MNKSIAALLHGYSWDIDATEIPIAEDISFCRLKDSQIKLWYEKLCYDEGIDDGDPFEYETFLRLKDQKGESLIDFSDPHSLVNRFCNLLTVVTGSPVGMCRVLVSRNNFRYEPETNLAFVLVGQTEFLPQNWPHLTPQLLDELKVVWDVAQELWEADKSRGRIANALLFFYTAWRSHYMEHICLNLAVTLEILFAPSSNAETTHQIAFNISRFLGSDPEERECIFKSFKRFYGVRSSIVHGGIPDDSKIIDATVEAFPKVTTILRTLLLDRTLARTFNDESARREYLKAYLFR